MVETEVILTDSATLALDRKATTFEAVPPGQQETRINPTAISRGRFINITIIHPKKGIITNWRVTPHINAAGKRKTLLKSLKVKVNPIPNIINPRPIWINSVEYQLKTAGQISATTATRTDQRGNKFVSNLKKAITTEFRHLITHIYNKKSIEFRQ